jgi:hypothetical protein
MSTHIRYVAKLTAGIGWLRAHYGERAAGWIALAHDQLAQGATDALKTRHAKLAPYDALGYIGESLRIARYPRDTVAMFRRRLLRAFPQHEQGGTRQAVLDELAEFAIGVSGLLLKGAILLEDWEYPADPQPWWSQFWIFFPPGTHPVVATTQEYGDGSLYGDGDVYGVEGIEAIDVAALRALVRAWKRASSILRAFVFVVSGEVYGVGGNVYGQTGLVYGTTELVAISG